MVSRIDHISIAVKNDKKARDFFMKIFSAIPGTSAEDPQMQYRWELMSLGDLSRLELKKVIFLILGSATMEIFGKNFSSIHETLLAC